MKNKKVTQIRKEKLAKRSKEELIEMIFHYEERLKEEIKYWNKVVIEESEKAEERVIKQIKKWTKGKKVTKDSLREYCNKLLSLSKEE
jgi:molecular chaperone DnaK (HSP70)